MGWKKSRIEWEKELLISLCKPWDQIVQLIWFKMRIDIIEQIIHFIN